MNTCVRIVVCIFSATGVDAQLICKGTLDSPEWRKGPTGPKTLCNACGLRWAKKEKKEKKQKVGSGKESGLSAITHGGELSAGSS